MSRMLDRSRAALVVVDVLRHEKTVFSAARADGFSLDGRDQALIR